MKTTCKTSWPVNICILLTAKVVPKIFPILNVVAHLVITCGQGFLPAEPAYFCLLLASIADCVETLR